MRAVSAERLSGVCNLGCPSKVDKLGRARYFACNSALGKAAIMKIMKLKTATLIAIVGLSTEFIFAQCWRFFRLYEMFPMGPMRLNVLFLIVGALGTGSLVLFLVTLYSKQP